MKKQTALQWFFSELERMQYFIGNDMLEALKQAKAMEKEQIVHAFKAGLASPYHQDYAIVTQKEEGTKSGQYYNEIYGGDK